MIKKEWETVMEEEGEILAVEADYGKFRLIVHQFMTVHGHWYVSCEGLFSVVLLAAEDLSGAKIQAKAKLQVVLQDALDSMSAFNKRRKG